MQKRFAFIIPFVVVVLLLMFSHPCSSQENLILYLHENEVLDDIDPNKGTDSIWNMRDKGIWMTSPMPFDTTVNGDIDIILWLKAGDPQYPWTLFRIPKVSMYDISPDGTKTEIGHSRKLVNFLQENISEISFTLRIEEYEIDNEHILSLEINTLLSTELLYDSYTHKSRVSLPYSSPGDIELVSSNTQKSIHPQGNATYSIRVQNMGSIKDTIELSHDYTGTQWDVTLDKATVTVSPGDFAYITLRVTPIDVSIGDALIITLTGTGETDTDSIQIITRIREAVHGVNIEPPLGKTGEPGDKIEYNFTVTNTGEVNETYILDLSVDDTEWDVKLKGDRSVFVEAGGDVIVIVEVKIPSDAENLSTSLVTLSAQSQNTFDAAGVTTRVFFDTSKNIENWTPYLVIIIVIAIIVFVILHLSQGGFMKRVKLVCIDRLKEVAPGGVAKFLITIINPLKKQKEEKNIYHLDIKGDIPLDWKAKLDTDTVLLGGKEKKDITLEVQSAHDAKVDDWASVEVWASEKEERGKDEKISVVVLTREPTPDITIKNVTYEPETFTTGDRVTLNADIINKGSAPAENTSIKLMVNDEEHNRVEGINIPPMGRVSIKMPWIAYPGENRVYIKVE